MSGKNTVIDEHFWFTATTLAVNGFIISTKFNPPQMAFITIFSTLISCYAIFLIVHRSAADADKIDLPEDLRKLPESKKTFIDKGRETWYHLKIFPKHFLFVVFEFSGALFYVFLVFASCVAVWICCYT